MIVDRYHVLQDAIRQKLLSCGRKEDDTTLVVVTKTQPPALIEELYQAGCRQFGENRVQEALAKMPLLPPDCQWHLIGHLQTNKIAKILSSPISLIHSVDTFELAEKLSQASVARKQETNILLQVNTSGELSKQGLSQEEWEKHLDSLSQLPALRMEGLMTMAPLTEDAAVIRACFRKLRLLREEWKKHMPHLSSFKHLSMGMSNDYLLALEEGATLLRIGSAIFGF